MLGDLLHPVTPPIPLPSPLPIPLPIPSQDPGSRGRLRIGLPGQEWAAPGQLTLVVAPTRWLEGLESRLLLDAVAGGRDAFLVSGDNRLDAYGLLAEARARGMEAELADGVWIARAFTVHQLVALLEEALPLAGRQRPLGVALATGLMAMFLDEDVAPHEARALFTRSVRRLEAWARSVDFPVVATVAEGSGARAEALLGAVGRGKENQGARGNRNVPDSPFRAAKQRRLEVA